MQRAGPRCVWSSAVRPTAHLALLPSRPSGSPGPAGWARAAVHEEAPELDRGLCPMGPQVSLSLRLLDKEGRKYLKRSSLSPGKANAAIRKRGKCVFICGWLCCQLDLHFRKIS